MSDDSPEIHDETDIETAEAAVAFARPPVGAIKPIRDPADEPFVFRFEVGPAILIQLLEKLSSLDVFLIRETITAKYPGFYQLFYDGKPVYIGKTARPIGVRIKEHLKTLRGRIPPDAVGCRFAYVEDPSLVDVAEGALINFFDELGQADWNRSGFGSKTQGYGRATTRTGSWDEQFPTRLDYPVEAGKKGPIKLAALIRLINLNAPITFTIPREHTTQFRIAHTALLDVPVQTRAFTEWVVFVEEQLSADWVLRREPRSWYIVPR